MNHTYGIESKDRVPAYRRAGELLKELSAEPLGVMSINPSQPVYNAPALRILIANKLIEQVGTKFYAYAITTAGEAVVEILKANTKEVVNGTS